MIPHPQVLLARGLSSPLGGLLHRGAWGIADQVVTSLATFATLIIVARAVSPSDFGVFSLTLTFLVLQTTFAGAVTGQPFLVISATRHGSAYRQYVTSVIVAQLMIGVISALPVLLIAGIAASLAWDVAALIAVVAPAMLLTQLQEFIRSVFYVEDRIPLAFFNDVIRFGGQVVLILLLLQAGWLNPVLAIATVSVTSGLAAAIGFFEIRSSIASSISRAGFVADNLENWRFSRWTLGSTGLLLASNQALHFVIAGMSGVALAGAIRAIVTVLGPTHILFRGMYATFGPRAARTYEREGMAGLKQMVQRIFIVVGPPLAVYCLIAAAFARPLLSIVYGEQYVEYAWLLPFLSLSYFVQFLHVPIEIALRALRDTRVLFRAALWNFLSLWVIAVPGIYFFDLAGLVFLFLAMPVVFGIELWRRYLREASTVPAAASLNSQLQRTV